MGVRVSTPYREPGQAMVDSVRAEWVRNRMREIESCQLVGLMRALEYAKREGITEEEMKARREYCNEKRQEAVRALGIALDALHESCDFEARNDLLMLMKARRMVSFSHEFWTTERLRLAAEFGWVVKS